MNPTFPDVQRDITLSSEKSSLNDTDQVSTKLYVFHHILDKHSLETHRLDEFVKSIYFIGSKEGLNQNFYNIEKSRIMVESFQRRRKLDEKSVMETIEKKFKDFNVIEPDVTTRELQSKLERASNYNLKLKKENEKLKEMNDKKHLMKDYMRTLHLLGRDVMDVKETFFTMSEKIEKMRKDVKTRRYNHLESESRSGDLVEQYRDEINKIQKCLRYRKPNVEEFAEIEKQMLEEAYEREHGERIEDEDIEQQKMSTEDSECTPIGC